MDITTRKHPLYLDNFLEWNFLTNSYIGGKDYINSSNLFRHKAESSLSHSLRLKRAYYYNYCQPVVDIYNQYIFSAKVIREFKTEADYFTEVLNNSNGAGDNINVLMSGANKLSAINGISYIAVIPQDITEEPAVLTRIVAQKPIITNLHATTIIDWALDEKGEFIWVLIKLKRYVDSNPLVERILDNVYILWTKDEWIEFNATGVQTKRANNLLGLIPIVPVTHFPNISRENLIGRSLITDIARINRAVFNWCSLLDTILYDQTFSLLVIEGAGAPIDTGKVGTSDAFTYENGTKTPVFISPDVKQGELFIGWIDRAIREMYRLACLERSGITNRTESPVSGISKAFDFIDTNQAVGSKSSILNETEYDVFALCWGWKKVLENDAQPFTSIQELKTEVKKFVSIVYPQMFDYTAYFADLKVASDALKLQISDTFNKQYKKTLIPKLLSNTTKDILDKISKEIDEEKSTIGSNTAIEEKSTSDSSVTDESKNESTS